MNLDVKEIVLVNDQRWATVHLRLAEDTPTAKLVFESVIDARKWIRRTRANHALVGNPTKFLEIDSVRQTERIVKL